MVPFSNNLKVNITDGLQWRWPIQGLDTSTISGKEQENNQGTCNSDTKDRYSRAGVVRWPLEICSSKYLTGTTEKGQEMISWSFRSEKDRL